MIHITDKHHCCGCEACVQVCPRQCITFEEDSEGFRYPLADETDCIECGLCEKVCPVQNPHKPGTAIHILAARNKDEEELLASSSGGLFIVIAQKVIKDGGVVFGAKFDSDWNVIHSYADTMEGVKAFMGSKYVQSRIGNTFSVAKDFLKAGRKVLFTGTSCQIAALKNFLRKDYDNLLTIDVICHGVPSPKVWRKYLEEIKGNAPGGVKNSVSSPLNPPISERNALSSAGMMKIMGISFRDKRISWKKYSFALTLAKPSGDGKQNTVSLSHIHREDSYMRLFLSNLILRPSCYRCPAKGGRSLSDLTIADYWGIEDAHPEFDDERGVGLLIVNSKRSESWIDWEKLSFITTSLPDAVNSNFSYYKSVIPPEKRTQAFLLINSGKSTEEVVKKLLRISILTGLKSKIKIIMKRILKG